MRLIDSDFLIDCIKPQLGTGEVLFDEVMKKFIGILEATPTIDAVSEWIPCSERLPSNFSEDETVLATTDVDGDRVIAMFALDVKSFYLKGYVSAWMPLPKPYGEREDE